MSGGGGGAPEPASPSAKQNVFGEPEAGSVNLNLTALMDILSNLLFFLLASFGATIVMGINASVPVASADKSDVADTKQSVTVNINLTKESLAVSAMGTAQSEADLAPFKKTIPYDAAKPDFTPLSEHLLAIKEKFPRSDTIILTPEAGTNYETLIRVMDAAREREVRTSFKRTRVKLFPTVVVSTVVK